MVHKRLGQNTPGLARIFNSFIGTTNDPLVTDRRPFDAPLMGVHSLSISLPMCRPCIPFMFNRRPRLTDNLLIHGPSLVAVVCHSLAASYKRDVLFQVHQWDLGGVVPRRLTPIHDYIALRNHHQQFQPKLTRNTCNNV